MRTRGRREKAQRRQYGCRGSGSNVCPDNAEGWQFLVSTHAPILLGYPGAKIYGLSGDGIAEVPYEKTELVKLTSSFLDSREQFLHHLFKD